MGRGVFITFEGTEGCGKTTQAARLSGALRAGGRSVVLTREPGGTRFGGLIRQLILDPNNSELCFEAEALLYAADRAQHVREKVLPALESGLDVVCDRYVDSSIAYQGAAGGLGQDWVQRINDMATGGLRPELTILLDCDPQEGLSRRGRAGAGFDRIEQRDMEYHARVRDAFLALAHANPARVATVNVTGLGVSEVSDAVISVVRGRLASILPRTFQTWGASE